MLVVVAPTVNPISGGQTFITAFAKTRKKTKKKKAKKNPITIGYNNNGTFTVIYTNKKYSDAFIYAWYKPYNIHKQHYPLKKGRNEVTIPYFESGQDYINLIIALESDYSVIARKRVSLPDYFPDSLYTSKHALVNWNDNAPYIEKALELYAKAENTDAFVKSVIDYVCETLTYDKNFDKKSHIPLTERAFREKRGMCLEYSSMVAAMCRSMGVPAKVTYGRSNNTKDGLHAWNEIFVDGEWKIVDTVINDGEIRLFGEITDYYLDPNDYFAKDNPI